MKSSCLQEVYSLVSVVRNAWTDFEIAVGNLEFYLKYYSESNAHDML